jgi:hypothetical protein
MGGRRKAKNWNIIEVALEEGLAVSKTSPHAFHLRLLLRS